MSLTPCAHDGRRRPVAVTCCERCERFPACLPPASPQLRAEIAGTCRAGTVEREMIALLLDTLEAIVQDDEPDESS
jgi:hypothetical protein